MKTELQIGTPKHMLGAIVKGFLEMVWLNQCMYRMPLQGFLYCITLECISQHHTEKEILKVCKKSLEEFDKLKKKIMKQYLPGVDNKEQFRFAYKSFNGLVTKRGPTHNYIIQLP